MPGLSNEEMDALEVEFTALPEEADLDTLTDRQLAACLFQVWLDMDADSLESEVVREAVIRLVMR